MHGSRRKHPSRTVCLTKNSEYHIKDGICVGVRDRRSGAWLMTHHAHGRVLAGALIYRQGDVVLCSTPSAGDHLVFDGGCAVTSAIETVSKETGPMHLPTPAQQGLDEEQTPVLVQRTG